MIRSHIREVALARKIKNAKELGEKAGLHLNVAYRVWAGDFKRIDTETLDRLCVLLRVKVGKLIEHEKG